MEPFKHVLVGLDTSPMDALLVKYAAFVVDHSSAEKVEFVNVVKHLNIPTDVKKEFPELERAALKEREDKLRATVSEYFNPAKKVSTEISIISGQAGELLQVANRNKSDLIIVGQKKNDTGVTTLRLARRASCNLLIVPENDLTPAANKFMVPIDFSSYSRLALEQTIDFTVKTGGTAKIICQNVYNVPAGYHYTGKSFDEFAEIMKQNSQKEYQKFVANIDFKGIEVEDVYSLDTNDNLASDIYDLADEIHPDFIIIGAKGRTAAAALFLGSLAEKMVNEKMNYPLLVVRFKGKSAGLLETLREI